MYRIMSVDFYCGVSERVWNHHPVTPGPLACVSPICGRTERTKKENWVAIPAGTKVIQDSGAFSDGPSSRLSLEAALDRQIAHAERHSYADKLAYRASYDLLIDEKWTNGKRSKHRWTESEAESAVDVTVAAAEYIAKEQSNTGLILSAQGVSPQQYFKCTERVIDYIDPAKDILGLGGWCILGIRKSLMPVFLETVGMVIPYAANRGIRRVHIWGVIYADGLGKLLWLCNEHGIELSTDSVGPSVRPVYNKWGYADWVNPNYRNPGPEKLGADRARHVAEVRQWLGRLDESQFCKQPTTVHVPHKRRSPNGEIQLSMF